MRVGRGWLAQAGLLVVGSSQTSQLFFACQLDVINLILSEVQSQFELSLAQFSSSLFLAIPDYTGIYLDLPDCTELY